MQRWVGGVLGAAVMTWIVFTVAPADAQQCKKEEKACNGKCIPKKQICVKVKTAKPDEASEQEKGKVQGDVGKSGPGGKSIDDKLKGGGDNAVDTTAKPVDTGAKPASSSIPGCRSHANLDGLSRTAAEQWISSAGWAASGEPKVKTGEGYEIVAFNVTKGKDKAVVGVYIYKNSAAALKLNTDFGTHKNIASALSADGKHVIAAILPKSGNKAEAKGLLEGLVSCEK